MAARRNSAAGAGKGVFGERRGLESRCWRAFCSAALGGRDAQGAAQAHSRRASAKEKRGGATRGGVHEARTSAMGSAFTGRAGLSRVVGEVAGEDRGASRVRWTLFWLELESDCSGLSGEWCGQI